MSVSDHRPSWRRNFLPTYTRFASPLHVAFPFPPQPGKRVIIGPDPIPDADDASREATFLNVQAIQRLDTVNCLWDACTVLCGYMIAHANQIFDRCSLGSRNRFTVVEIGSGCGVLGMVAEECLQSHARTRSGTPEVVVVMTEIESEIDVLKQTVSLNKEDPTHLLVEPLPWGSASHLDRLREKVGGGTQPDEPWVNLILATDIVYELQHFDLLVDTIGRLCPRNSSTRLLMAMERRWSDITRFWWEDVSKQGWKWEIVPKGERREWWEEVEEIDVIWMWRL